MNNQSHKWGTALGTSLKRTNQISARINRLNGLVIKEHEFYQLELRVQLNKSYIHRNIHTYHKTTIGTTLISPVVFILSQTEDSLSAISLSRTNPESVKQLIFLYTRKLLTEDRLEFIKQTISHSQKKGNLLQESPIRTYLIKNIIAIKELSTFELLTLLNDPHKPAILSRR